MASTCASAWAIRSMGALALPTHPRLGVLSGEHEWDGDVGEVPTTVAFLTDSTPRYSGTTDQWLVAKLLAGETVMAVEVPGTNFFRDVRIVKPIEPLPENVTFAEYRDGGYWGSYQTTTSRDETAPSRPEVVGGDLTFYEGSSCGSCGDETWAHIQLKAAASDDQTPEKRLVYAIYLGSSQDEARTTLTPQALYMGSLLSSNLTLRQAVPNDWLERNVFVAIAAIDQRGNVSERSTPVQIHTPDTEGCAIKRHGRPLRFSPSILLAIAALEWMRRRRNAATRAKPRRTL